MICYEEALKIAKELKPNINRFYEYDDAYLFYSTKDKGCTGGLGHTPVVIMKADGTKAVYSTFILSGGSEPIAHGKV